MRLIIHLFLSAILIVTVLGSFFFKNTALSAFFNVSDLLAYIRIISILCAILVIVLALGYKRRLEISQRYRQADQVLAESKATAKRKERAAMLLEEKLRADYDRKTEAMNAKMDEFTAEHNQKMHILRTHNLQLKDAASKMLKIIRKYEMQ